MNTMKLAFVGDVQIDKGINNQLLGEKLEKNFLMCDIRCCNLEGPCVAEESLPPVKEVGPCLKQGENAVSVLQSSGFNMVSLANNHIMDYGSRALLHTLSEFKDFYRIGIHNPELNSNYVVIKKGGVSVAFLAAAENAFGCIKNSNIGFNYLLDAEFSIQIKELKKTVDYVIVNAHIGAEGLQIPFPEVKELYHYLADAGADCIIGHHPHVVQGFEDYHDTRIYYSLGNFRLDDYEIETDAEQFGAAVFLEISKDGIHYSQMITKNAGGIVEKCETDLFQYLNACLDDEDVVDQWCIKMYKSVFRQDFYRGGLLEVWDQTLISRIKMIMKLLFRRLKFSDAFLFHNVCVDTNLWLTQRALNNLSKNNEI